MTPSKPFEQGNSAAMRPTPVADTGSNPPAADDALDTLATAVRDIRHDAAPVLERATERASDLAHRGLDAVRGTSRELRHQSLDASDRTVAYIKDEPVKAMLIAAATGAALMALITLVSRSRHHG